MTGNMLIPEIFIKEGAAVRSAEDDITIIDTDPVRLAGIYAEAGPDALIITDLSVTDRDHDRSVSIMQDICSAVRIPVYGQGRIRRMEDVKKILYAGCRKAILDFDRIDHETMFRELTSKFGEDRIMVSISSSRLSRSSISKVSEAGSELMLRGEAAHAYLKSSAPEEFFGSIPIVICMETVSLEQIMELFRKGAAALCGNCITDNIGSLSSIRRMLDENGLAADSDSLSDGVLSFEDLKKGPDGLVPVVVLEAATDEVLMVAYMNREAYELTLKSGRMTYYSRSRRSLWVKGETSGHYQFLISLRADCDRDTLLARVRQIGAACHTGHHSCFFTTVFEDTDAEIHNPASVLKDDYATIMERKASPKEGSYTTYLFEKGIDKMLKKLGEENTEIIIAAKNPDSKEIVYEIADYLYHMMVVMAEKDVTWDDVYDELVRRQKSSQSKE